MLRKCANSTTWCRYPRFTQDQQHEEEEEEEEHQGEEEMSEDRKDSEVDYRSGTKDNQPKQVSNYDIRRELIETIEEATKECKDQEAINLRLQSEIVKLRKLTNAHPEKASEFNMSDVKYANTLARVHQIRLDLRQTQEKYEKMTRDMREKLADKLQKCNELRSTFMELKREVSKKAAFSKKNKGITDQQIEDWERREEEKTTEVACADPAAKAAHRHPQAKEQPR